MITTIVLIKCDPKEIPHCATRLAGIDGVSEVYSVSGEWDLVAIVRVQNHEDLARVIPGGVGKVAGVERTETLIAFQVYSKHDLESMFSVGFEDEV